MQERIPKEEHSAESKWYSACLLLRGVKSQDTASAEGLLEANITQRVSKTQTYVQPVNYMTA